MTLILSVTPNPAMDVTYDVSHLTVGDVNRVDQVRRRAGGKGVNVARVVTQLGESALIVAPVGGAAGAEFATELDAAGLAHRLVPISGGDPQDHGGGDGGWRDHGPLRTRSGSERNGIACIR